MASTSAHGTSDATIVPPDTTVTQQQQSATQPQQSTTVPHQTIVLKQDFVNQVILALVDQLQLSGKGHPSSAWLIQVTDVVSHAISTMVPNTEVSTFLSLCLPTFMSTPLNGGQPFVFPTKPLPKPNLKGDWGDNVSQQIEMNTHQQELLYYSNMVALENALRALILKILPVEYLPSTFARPSMLTTAVWPLNYYVYQLINELFATWNHPQDTDSHHHESLHRSTWDFTSTTLLSYFSTMDRAQDIATLLSNPYTDRQRVYQAYGVIKRTIKFSGTMGDANKKWTRLPFAQQTYANLQKIFSAAYKICLIKKETLEAADTMPSTEGAFAVPSAPTPLQDDDSVTTIVGALGATLSESISATYADLTDRMAILEANYQAPPPSQYAYAVAPQPPLPSIITQTQAPPMYGVPPPAPPPPPPGPPPPATVPPQSMVPTPAPAAPPVPQGPPPTTPTGQHQRGRRNQNPPNPVKKHANHLYCASHGCDVDHSSPQCKKKRDGHDDRIIHKDQAKAIRDANPTFKMPCLAGYSKTLWPASS